MATSFAAAALGAEGLGADVRMLIGNGYLPGHAAYALDLFRRDAGVRALFEARQRVRSAAGEGRRPGPRPQATPRRAFSMTSDSAGWIQYWPLATSPAGWPKAAAWMSGWMSEDAW